METNQITNINTLDGVTNIDETATVNTSGESMIWSVEHEKILIEWADKAMCYRWLHDRSHSLFSNQNAWYTIPCIIISTLAGTANFAQQRVPIQYQGLFTMVVGGINILGGIISTIQQFLKITQLNEAHRVSSIAWDKFYRNTKIELAKHPSERIQVNHMLKMSKEEFDRLMETSPTIPDKIVNQFKSAFKHTPEFDKISKPEICDVLVSTENFRNPWYNDDNKDKRNTEILAKRLQQESRKKQADEKNVLVVQNFKKTFINLHNREPMENEIITNLKDSMDVSLIKNILDNIQAPLVKGIENI